MYLTNARPLICYPSYIAIEWIIRPKAVQFGKFDDIYIPIPMPDKGPELEYNTDDWDVLDKMIQEEINSVIEYDPLNAFQNSFFASVHAQDLYVA